MAAYLEGDPQFIANTDWTEPDPEFPEWRNPEGNAHQAWFSPDNRFFIATDEDFAPHRMDEFSITTGPNAGVWIATLLVFFWILLPGVSRAVLLAFGVAAGGLLFEILAKLMDRTRHSLPE